MREPGDAGSRGIRVFVNERSVTVPPGATALDAVAAFDPALAAAVGSGDAYLTDGRMIRLDAGAGMVAGSIVRVVRSARQRGEGPAGDVDADA